MPKWQPTGVTTSFETLSAAQADEQLDAVARILYLAYCQTDLHNRASSSLPKQGIHRKKRSPL